mmetsp:Transcript_40134/g.83587  ORF Transcript_40134/g.83587 Transcript_40134/m.83587 type:complete len:675 (-) Transcript_40134:297-2321(-)
MMNHHTTCTPSRTRWLWVALVLCSIPSVALAWSTTIGKSPTPLGSRLALARTPPLTRRYATSSDGSDDDHNESPNISPSKKKWTRPSSSSDAVVPVEDQGLYDQNRTAYYEKQYSIRRARAKIDSILNSGPDAPIDLERELQRVTSIAPPPTQTAMVSPRVASLERNLTRAMHHGDWDTAAATEQALGEAHVQDCGAVLHVNAQYYQAFSHKDYEQMTTRVWHPQDPTATCIHPSQKPLVGSKAVSSAWRQMFAAKAGAFQKTWMEPHHIRLSLKGGTVAVVTCTEHVYARRFVRGQARSTELVNKLQATNVFRKMSVVDPQTGEPTKTQWFLTHHHASWHAETPAAQQALSAREGGATKDEEGPRGLDQDMDDDDDLTAASNAMDHIMGIRNFGPLLGDGDNNNNQRQSEKSEEDMIMGTLSDIINGAGGGAGGPMDPNNPLGGGPRKAIIRVARIDPTTGQSIPVGRKNININPIDDDDDDDEQASSIMDDLMSEYDESDDGEEDDEEDDDNRYDDHDDHDEGQEDVFLTGRPLTPRPKKMMKHPKKSSPKPKSSRNNRNAQQSCLAALRQLSERGSISPRQKRVLVTDIIQSSARTTGELSMVEVAYQLLVAPTMDENDTSSTEEQEEALEEFADQCRVLASNLWEANSVGSSSSSATSNNNGNRMPPSAP